MFFFQLSKAELDLENILKQITPETHDAEISPEKNIERLRREDDVISDEMKNVINSLQAPDSKVTTEKRDSDAEEKKKFSVVKIPDAGKNNQTALKLNNIASNNPNDEAGSGSGSDLESGSGSDSGSGDSETDSDDKRPSLMTKSDAALAMNIEGDDGSGSGSGDDASGAGADSNAFKRNLMESSPLKNNTQSAVTNGTTNIEIPISVNGNVSQASTLNPGGFNEAPMIKTESTKVDGNATLKEVKYFKPQENTTEIIDRVNNNNSTKVNQNTTFAKVLSNAAGNNNTKQASPGSKRDTLPDEVSNVADNLFNFENDDEGKAPATTSTSAAGNTESADDSLPGSQGGPIAEDLMSSMTSPMDKKSVISNATVSVKGEQAGGNKKWKVVNSSEASGSGGVPDNEIKMQVESSIGKSFDASMKRIANNMEAELLPGDYGDDSLSLSDLSGSGSGEESGGDQESGSGEAENENLFLNSKKKSAIRLKNNTFVEPESDLATDESGDAESGSGSGASGSGSGDFDTLLSTKGEPAAAESAPFGLHAIEATSSMKPVKTFRHNMSGLSLNLKNSSLHNFFEPESDTQSFLGETDASEDSESGSGEESGDDVSGDAAGESVVGEDDEATLKPSVNTEENPFAKDQVAGAQQTKAIQVKDTSGESNHFLL